MKRSPILFILISFFDISYRHARFVMKYALHANKLKLCVLGIDAHETWEMTAQQFEKKPDQLVQDKKEIYLGTKFIKIPVEHIVGMKTGLDECLIP